MGEKAKAHHRDGSLMMMKCYRRHCSPRTVKRDKSHTGATHAEEEHSSGHF